MIDRDYEPGPVELREAKSRRIGRLVKLVLAAAAALGIAVAVLVTAYDERRLPTPAEFQRLLDAGDAVGDAVDASIAEVESRAP